MGATCTKSLKQIKGRHGSVIITRLVLTKRNKIKPRRSLQKLLNISIFSLTGQKSVHVMCNNSSRVGAFLWLASLFFKVNKIKFCILSNLDFAHLWKYGFLYHDDCLGGTGITLNCYPQQNISLF